MSLRGNPKKSGVGNDSHPVFYFSCLRALNSFQIIYNTVIAPSFIKHTKCIDYGLKRNQIANFLGLTLIILTISVAGAGYITYKNLEQIVSKLETEAKPNNNLLLYKEILITLNAMENQVESYQLSEEKHYLTEYNQNNFAVSHYLDSINRTNQQDRELLVYNDSLTSLIGKKTRVLNELLQITPDNPNSNLSKLEAKLNEVTEIVTITRENPGLQLESKKGFLKRLFENDEEVETIRDDSILLARAQKYRIELHEEIENIKASIERDARLKRSRKMQLEASHFDIQNQITDLINFLESRETVKFNLNTLKAQELASRTNQQIVIFSSLATALLIMSVFVMFNYVRKNREYQHLLRESKQSTEALAKAKEQFFANMSHEIRTPMNAISGFTKILLRSNLDKDQKEQVEIINKSSEHLLKLLNDILDFSKLQAEKLQLESSVFNLKQVCVETIQLLQESADKKGLQLNFIFVDQPEFLIGDPHRLKQILLNILNNSIKYTETGEVRLEVTSKKTKDHLLVQFRVNDTGIGISKSQQAKLFQEFEQANQSSFSKGSGLGLAITKKLVMLHNGEIDLKSDEGKGTVITIKLKYDLSSTPPLEVAMDQFDDNLETVRVLIADDEPFNVKLLSTLLSRHRISHDEAFDGQKAHDLLMKNEYDVILLDLKMPEMNGWQIVESIKSQPGPNRNKPFIALTATITKLDQKKGQEVGFDYIMRKPFDENKLFEFIASNARVKSPDARVQDQVDLSSLYSMGDKEFVEDMVETFILSACDGMNAILAGFEAGDFDKIALMAHRIVAPARHFKAVTLVHLLKDLQQRAEANSVSITPEMLQKIEWELDQVINSLRDYMHKEITN